MAAGLPVVGTPISFDGIDAVHERDALVVEVEPMAAAVVDLLADQDMQARLSQQGRALVTSRYSWSGVAERYTALYDAIQ
jgi:glycosyltransferase involved in cell wall biosynthesis